MPYMSKTTTTTIRYDGKGGKTTNTTTTNGAPMAIPPARTPRATLNSNVTAGGISAADPIPVSRGGSSGTAKDYASLKKELLAAGKLYEDPDFPAIESSIFYSRKPPRPFEWKRPTDFCKNPEFITGGASRFDVQQGQLGDCWLLAAVASLSMHSELFNQVVPPDQSFSSGYCGMFKFHFWRFGEWKEVIVDDRLPTQNNQLVFMHSKENNEFWSALLEKAYSKLVGSYEALKGGSSSEAMEDFTGGLTEFFDLRGKEPKDLFDIMLRAQTKCCLMGCSIDADPSQIEAKMPNGLIMGHAYSVTDVKLIPNTIGVDISITGKSGKIPLVRIRNPWGNESEWTGAWSDKSREWQLIDEKEREKMGLNFDDDGEFWMSYADFTKNFMKLEICHLGPQSMQSDGLGGKNKTRWEMCLENGAWKKRVTAGGCRNFLDTFWTNPQFRVSIVDPDDTDDDNAGTVVIGIMQKDMRKKRKEGVEMHTMGYAIYKIKDPNADPLDMSFFKYNASTARSPAFINMREVCGRHKLEPGHYCIVPSTFEPNQEAEFLVRIFSEKPYDSGEIDQSTGMKPVEPPRDLTPQEDAQVQALRESFKRIAGVDLEVDAYELQSIVNAAFKKAGGTAQGVISMDVTANEFNFDGFGIETCRSMVAMMDLDQSGKLGFDEFKNLWNDLRLWKTVFKKYDTDKSGTFNSYELRQALGAVGFTVSNSIFNSLVMRYASQDGGIQFDEFVLCCTRLKTIFETFKAQDKDARGNAVFDMDTFIRCIMYV